MRFGEQYKFGLKLEDLFGKGIAEELLIKSRTTVKYSNDDLEAMILYYNNLVNQL